MRLAPIPPAELSMEQKPLYHTLRAGIQKQFSSFKAVREDGALLGPFNPWLHEPHVGKAVWALTESLASRSVLPDEARQIAILVTGARFKAAFEIYAHVHVAREKQLAASKLATIVAGQRPHDLDEAEAAAFDVTYALGAGGVLPRATYERAHDAFGPHGVAELIYLVGLYAMVCTTLNGFDVPVPEQQDGSAAGQ